MWRTQVASALRTPETQAREWIRSSQPVLDMVDASGFYGAPVTKALCGLTLGGFSVLSFTEQKKQYMKALSHNNILRSVNMLTTPLCLLPSAEVLCDLLLYTFRQLERKMGSIKFASYTIVSAVLGLTVQLAFLVVFKRPLTPGPLPIIFSLLLPCPRAEIVAVFFYFRHRFLR